MLLLIPLLTLGLVSCGIRSDSDSLQSDNSSMKSEQVEDDDTTGTVDASNTVSLSNGKVGDVVHLGKVSFIDYYGGHFSDDIGWRILGIEADHVLVISENVIDIRLYNNEDEGTSWEKSDLRRWLNLDFWAGLPEDMKKLTLTTQVVNDDNPDSGTAGGVETEDKVFLLSMDEAEKYFSSDRDRQSGINLTAETIEKIKDGFHINLKDDVAEFGGIWWWLRSPGSNTHLAAYVGGDGIIYSLGMWVHASGAYGTSIGDGGGVRPALWLDR